jgi:hypothetical protein
MNTQKVNFMLLPIMGLFMVGIPVAGFLAGMLCLCLKRLRFLAPFAFLMPVFTSYAAIFGFWGGAIGLEKLGTSEALSGIGGLICLLVVGALGASTAYRFAKRLGKAVSR